MPHAANYDAIAGRWPRRPKTAFLTANGPGRFPSPAKHPPPLNRHLTSLSSVPPTNRLSPAIRMNAIRSHKKFSYLIPTYRHQHG
jgi:hypothetical protein